MHMGGVEAQSRFVGAAIGCLGLLGGIGLIAVVEFGRSFWAVASLVGGPSLAVAVLGWRASGPAARNLLRSRARIGLVAGLAALAGYDGVRWALVALLDYQVNPFEAFPHFGEVITGSDAMPLSWLVGAAFHTFNGIGFAVFYALLLGGRHPMLGIAWAVFLEGFTLALYPGWLDIRVLQEFTIVSVAGHLAYGAILGLTCWRWLAGSAFNGSAS